MIKSTLIINFFYRYVYLTVVLITLLLILTACSSTRFFYVFIENFIKDEVTYFLNLDEKEELLLNQQVSEMVSWQRKYMLPKYGTYLTNISDRIETNKFKKENINEIINKGRTLIQETVRGVTPYASKFLINHQTVGDIEYMKKKMAKRQHEQLEELSKPENVMYKNRLDKLKKNFKRFFGDLNDEQIDILEGYARATLGDSKTRLYNRTMRQKAFLQFLRTNPSEKEIVVYLNKLLLSGHEITNPKYKDFSEISLERFSKLLVDMLSSSSKEQRVTIISNLRNYANDFKNVSE